MNITQTIVASVVVACGSAAYAGAVVDLGPNQFAGGLSGIMNTQMSELIGSIEMDNFQDFSIYANTEGRGQDAFYEGTFMTRIVRSHETGNLHFNYRVLSPNDQLAGRISHIEVSGFEGFQTRVEFRNETTSPGTVGPEGATRSGDGSILDFNFALGLDTADESRYFFAMVDTDSYYLDSAIATIYLESGESVSMSIASANPIPAPGALGLLGAAGLISTRRRR